MREQLGSDRRRLIVFFGAGTSQAVGIDGIMQLTKNVGDTIDATYKPQYERLLADSGAGAHVEHVLNRVRLCRDMIADSVSASAGGLEQEKRRKSWIGRSAKRYTIAFPQSRQKVFNYTQSSLRG